MGGSQELQPKRGAVLGSLKRLRSNCASVIWHALATLRSTTVEQRLRATCVSWFFFPLDYRGLVFGGVGLSEGDVLVSVFAGVFPYDLLLVLSAQSALPCGMKGG